MSVDLNTVHKQRIREAVKAAKSGVKVCFRINPSGKIVWWDADKPRVQHVITNDCAGNPNPWLAAVLEEYQRQMQPNN